MRNIKVWLMNYLVTIEENIEVQSPWAIANFRRAVAAELTLDLEQGLEKLEWLEVGLEFDNCIHEARLAGDPDRRGGIEARAPGQTAQPGKPFRGFSECGLRPPRAAGDVAAHPNVDQRHGFQLTAPVPAGQGVL